VLWSRLAFRPKLKTGWRKEYEWDSECFAQQAEFGEHLKLAIAQVYSSAWYISNRSTESIVSEEAVTSDYFEAKLEERTSATCAWYTTRWQHIGHSGLQRWAHAKLTLEAAVTNDILSQEEEIEGKQAAFFVEVADKSCVSHHIWLVDRHI
jgi:hypothetical protein